mgnify:CR=1 FL=1
MSQRPTKAVRMPHQYLLPRMQVGESLVYPKKDYGRIRMFTWRYRKEDPSKVWVVRTEGENIRIWRTA